MTISTSTAWSLSMWAVGLDEERLIQWTDWSTLSMLRLQNRFSKKRSCMKWASSLQFECDPSRYFDSKSRVDYRFLIIIFVHQELFTREICSGRVHYFIEVVNNSFDLCLIDKAERLLFHLSFACAISDCCCSNLYISIEYRWPLSGSLLRWSIAAHLNCKVEVKWLSISRTHNVK